MKIKFEILPPIMPNFVRFKQEAGLKQDGFKVDDGYPIKDFSLEEAKEYAQLMYDSFLKHWESKQDKR